MTGVGGVERTLVVFDDIKAERDRQDAKWGDQSDSRDGTGPGSLPLAGMRPVESYMGAATLAEKATAQTDRHAQLPGGATMADILLEEVFEALAESDPVKLRTELVQAGAVIVAWCEYLDRRGAKP